MNKKNKIIEKEHDQLNDNVLVEIINANIHLQDRIVLQGITLH